MSREVDESKPAPHPAGRCSACGKGFTCGIAAGKETCWCFERPPLETDRLTDAGCLCPECLGERTGGR